MNISQIQSQLAFNRRAITRLHCNIECLKDFLKNYNAFPAEERLYVKGIQRSSKEIARLVVLQKALKKDLNYQIKENNIYNEYLKYADRWASCIVSDSDEKE
jgi:hypothetical protein